MWTPEIFGCDRSAFECSNANSGSPKHKATYALTVRTHARNVGTCRGSTGGEGGAATELLPSVFGSKISALRKHKEANSMLATGIANDCASSLEQN